MISKTGMSLIVPLWFIITYRYLKRQIHDLFTLFRQQHFIWFPKLTWRYMLPVPVLSFKIAIGVIGLKLSTKYHRHCFRSASMLSICPPRTWISLLIYLYVFYFEPPLKESKPIKSPDARWNFLVPTNWICTQRGSNEKSFQLSDPPPVHMYYTIAIITSL